MGCFHSKSGTDTSGSVNGLPETLATASHGEPAILQPGSDYAQGPSSAFYSDFPSLGRSSNMRTTGFGTADWDPFGPSSQQYGAFSTEIHRPPPTETTNLSQGGRFPYVLGSGAETENENFIQTVGTLSSLSSLMFRVNKSRREIAMVVPGYGHDAPQIISLSEKIALAFRDVLIFCEAMIPLLNQEFIVSSVPQLIKSYTTVTLALMTTSSIVDLHCTILTELKHALESHLSLQSEPGSPRKPSADSSPSARRSSSFYRGIERSDLPNTHGGDAGGAWRPFPTKSDSNSGTQNEQQPQQDHPLNKLVDVDHKNEIPFSSGSETHGLGRRPSGQSLPGQLPDAPVSDYRGSGASHLNLFIQLETMEFYLTQLAAICSKMRQRVENLLPAIFGTGLDPTTLDISGNSHSGQRILLDEIEGTAGRVLFLRGQVIDRLSRMRESM